MDEAQSRRAQADRELTQTQQRWWWPYTHPLVVKICIVLLILKVVLGVSAGAAVASRGVLHGWTHILNSRSLTYTFGTSELTEGEGSLFWNIAVNGYTDYDQKNIAKFPLYSAVTRSLWNVTGQSVSVTLILAILHSLMVWAGAAETYRFWEEYRAGYGRRAVLWLLLSPLFVLHIWLASYMEPGFISLMWLSLTLEHKRKWALGSAALLCLTMLQPSGVILACFLGIRRLYQWSKGKTPLAAVIWALLPGAAWLIWIVFTSLWFNRFLAAYAFQDQWGRGTFRWPWEQWIVFNELNLKPGFAFGYLVTDISIAWAALGFGWGGWLWIKLPAERRQRLGGAWVMPLFTCFVVLIPFCTLVASVQRYSLTTLIGVWPLLFSDRVQDHPVFDLVETLIWMLSLLMCLLILVAFVTGYKYEWILFF